MREINPTAWRELYRTEDRNAAQVLATCLEAMEFDLRVTRSALPTGARFSFEENDADLGSYVIEVPIPDWPDLIDVLPEIIAEQVEFDAFLAAWEAGDARANRRALLIITIIVAALATIGAIEL